MLTSELTVHKPRDYSLLSQTEPLTGGFDMLQYFETIFPLVEKQDEVYFRGGGAAGGL